MKVLLTFLFSIIIGFSYSQESINVKLLDSIPLRADTLIGIDNFENYYYIINNTFYKKTASQTYSYTNTQLGIITSVDMMNPLKIVLFYRDFNTVVILDNQLNELTNTISLTTESFAKNVALVNISSTNNLWLYSLDDNILSLWNYETKQIILNTQPLSFYEEDFQGVLQTSNYEFCWLVSKNNVLKFNEYGSFINSFTENNIQKVVPYLNGIVYLKNNKLFYHQNNEVKKILITDKKYNLETFTVSKNNLYFFEANVLYKYSFLKK